MSNWTGWPTRGPFGVKGVPKEPPLFWKARKGACLDVDSLHEDEAEDDEFRLRGGMSTAVRELSREDPFSSACQEDELILLEEAGEINEHVSQCYLDEFLDEKRNA